MSFHWWFLKHYFVYRVKYRWFLLLLSFTSFAYICVPTTESYTVLFVPHIVCVLSPSSTYKYVSEFIWGYAYVYYIMSPVFTVWLNTMSKHLHRIFLRLFWETYRSLVLLALCRGQIVKNKKQNIIKVDVSSNKLTYLCIGWWWRWNTYNMRDTRYIVGFQCWNANICKRRKTQQQEEPAVLNAINKIVFLKSSM